MKMASQPKMMSTNEIKNTTSLTSKKNKTSK